MRMKIAQLPQNLQHENNDNNEDSDHDIPAWKITEKKFAELQIQQIHFMERDDSNPNMECGNWYYVTKNFVQNEARIPKQLLKYYKFVVFFTFFSAIYWAFCCLMMPVVAMHAIERYISTDIRIQFSIYWFLQPFMYFSFIYTLSKLTLVYIRYSIVLALLNICWHSLNVVHMHVLFTNVYKSSKIENYNETPFQKKQRFKNQKSIQQLNGVTTGTNINLKYHEDLEKSIEKSDYPMSINNTDDYLNNSQIEKIKNHYTAGKMKPSQIANKKLAEKEKLSKLMQESRFGTHDQSEKRIQENKIAQYMDDEVYIQDQGKQNQSQNQTLNQIKTFNNTQQSLYKSNNGSQNQSHNQTATILKYKKERDNFNMKKQNSKVSFQEFSIMDESNSNQLLKNANRSIEYNDKNQNQSPLKQKNSLSSNLNGNRMHRTQSITKNQKFNLNGNPDFSSTNKNNGINQSIIQQEFDQMKGQSNLISAKQKWGGQRQVKLAEYQDSYEIQDTRTHKVEQDITKL
ncbi:hypothetical protein PPERSA_11737 [Pseudocohnilembus persalinus]|uniref:Transmembrane protein n=1 Tax=Pseudocohnilembus persalinus TaxID=266149 RepID=A0A0V0QGP2_PSEPJ|nr:hypothetical protein PPERSA_11737 [Pseudocohnilembus persalinus]|eukprot:KRX01290.1 hypothetical protein PPERSA_11737 [Pseudocohnilembus persalinus]